MLVILRRKVLCGYHPSRPYPPPSHSVPSYTHTPVQSARDPTTKPTRAESTSAFLNSPHPSPAGLQCSRGPFSVSSLIPLSVILSGPNTRALDSWMVAISSLGSNFLPIREFEQLCSVVNQLFFDPVYGHYSVIVCFHCNSGRSNLIG